MNGGRGGAPYAAVVRFEHDQSILAPLDDVIATQLDESYQRSLTSLPPLKERELIEHEPRADGGLYRVTRCVLAINISGMARNFIGDEDPAWREEAIWNPDTHTWTWKAIPEVAKDLLSAQGTIAFAADGHHTVRRVAGDVRVKVPLYGGKVEGWIVEGLKHTYDEEARRLLEWLERENV